MPEVHRPKSIRTLFVFDELDEMTSIELEGGFERATAVPVYKKEVGQPTHYVGIGGNEIVTTTLRDEVMIPLVTYTDQVIEGFSLSVAALIDQRLEALIDSVTFGREDDVPLVVADDVEVALLRALQGRSGNTIHLLDRLSGLRWGFAFAVLDFAGVLVKRGSEYGMFVDPGRVAFVRTEP